MYQINTENARFLQLGDEGIVYLVDNNEYLTLNETMFKILKSIENGYTEQKIIDFLQLEYDIDKETCSNQVKSSISALINNRIVRIA